MAENIAAGYSSPEAVTNGWINSYGHNANMLDASFGYASVSMFVVVDDVVAGEISATINSYQYSRYCVQNFWE